VVYALLSDNLGGGCLSVRWFVPLLAPFYWALAQLLARRPSFRPDFAILGAAGVVLGMLMWPMGPWLSQPIPYSIEIVRAAVIACVATRAVRIARRWRGDTADPTSGNSQVQIG
jgi:hypothetical protein